jgi:predicted transcriptional regulator
LVSRQKVTITNLAMMSRVNHQRCRELVGWLQDSGYAEVRVYRRKRYVILTESGYDYGRRLLEVNTMTRRLNAAEYNGHFEEPYKTR